MNTIYRIFAGTAVTAVLLSSQTKAQSVYPTGVTIYNPQEAYNSYIIFGAPDNKTHLIDMNGHEVRRWEHIGFPSGLIDPADVDGKRGHVLVQLENGPGVWGGIFNNKTVAEQDWDGNTVWQAPGGAARQNHDWRRLPNGNTLLLVSVNNTVLGYKNIGDQAIYEVSPQGKIVWKWIASEHLDEFGISPEGVVYLKKILEQQTNVGVSDPFLTINNMKVIGENHWFDEGDDRFDPENIVIDSRNANFIAIIEKKTGKIVWRLGPNYPDSHNSPNGRILETKLPRAVDQIVGQHDAHIIPRGLPGAGNLLVFDNQGGAGFPPAYMGIFSASRILEINPVTKQIIWQYTAANSNRPVWAFHSSFISSARRLPNGNTLIDEGMNGRFFQITAAGKIVWEYVNPFFATAQLRGQEVFTNWVYRAQPVPYNWVPDGTPRTEKPVKEIDITKFNITD